MGVTWRSRVRRNPIHSLLLETLVTSKTRLKLLLKFFLNPGNAAYLRSLEQEFQESSNGIRLELNRLEKADMLHSTLDGNKKVYKVNTDHPLYDDVNSIVKKYLGLDQLVERVTARLGGVTRVYLAGKLARGLYSDVVDVILIGEVDRGYLVKLIDRLEALIKKKIRYLIYQDIAQLKANHPASEILLLWENPKK